MNPLHKEVRDLRAFNMDFQFDFKFNKKYFTGASWPIPVGAACILVGAIPLLMMLMDIGGYGIFGLTAVGVFLMLGGVVLISFSAGGKTNEAGFNEQIDRATKNMEEDALKQLNLDEKHVKVIPLYDPLSFGEYDFSGEEPLLVRRGNDGKYRSSYYQRTLVMFTNEKMIVYRRRFCFTEDSVVSNLDVIPYLQFSEVNQTEHEYKAQVGKETRTIKYYLLHFIDESGKQITVTSRFDNDTDQLMENIKALVAKKKAAAQTANKAN